MGEADNVAIGKLGACRQTLKSSASPTTSEICCMQVSDAHCLLASEESLYLRGHHLLLYGSLRRLGRNEGWVLCASWLLRLRAEVTLPRARQHRSWFLANRNMTCHRWFYSSYFAVHLPSMRVGSRKDSAAPLLCKISEQCRFKNIHSSDLEGMRLAVTVSVLDPFTHFPSTFINARLPQVFKSPTPAIAFLRFVSSPRRFIPLSALTAFSILRFVH